MYSRIQMKKTLLIVFSSIILIFAMTGCAGALQTAIEKRNLDVETKMSKTIFLEPVEQDKQIVYLKVRNTTDKDMDIKSKLVSMFEQKGFKVTNNFKEAEFIIQTNLLQVGKNNPADAQNLLLKGFGSGLGGIVASSLVAGSAGVTSSRSFATAGLIGAVGGIVADSLVKDVYFTMITDVEIRQRNNDSTAEKKWNIYQTRVLSTANQVNLKFSDAKPVLIKGLAKSLSGLL